MAMYKISLLLYKTFNNTVPDKDWLDFSNHIICSGRQQLLIFVDFATIRLAIIFSQTSLVALREKFNLTS